MFRVSAISKAIEDRMNDTGLSRLSPIETRIALGAIRRPAKNKERNEHSI